jgi:hypothetical protein
MTTTNDSQPKIITAGSPKPPQTTKKTGAAKAEPISIPMTSGKGQQQKAAKALASKDRVPIKAAQSAKSAAKVARKSPGKMSGLAAAAKVLADAGKPLTSQEIVEATLGKGLWKSGGKTPHATIYAAMIREIAKKGSSGRFRKTDRGHFTVAKGTK